MGREAIPQNLRRMRQQRGWSQQGIAERAGLSLSGYCKIEKGQSVPGVDALEGLAKALGIGIQAMLRPIFAIQHVRFRRLRKLKLKSREQILVDVGRWYHDYAQLEEALHDTRAYLLNGFQAPGEGIPRAINAAQLVRTKMNLNGEAVQDPCGLIDAMRIKVLKVVVATDGFFGLSIMDETHGPAVVVNVWERIPVERWIFSAFHEVGHLLLHLPSYRITDDIEEPEGEEREADAFASHFLMPEGKFRKRWQETAGLGLVDRVLKVKRIFKVSYRSVLYRLKPMYPTENLFMRFAWQYKALYERDLREHQEPEPKLHPQAFDNKVLVPELDPLSASDFCEDRLEMLVRKAVLKGEISFNRGAEILNLQLETMRSVAATWHMDPED